jgi:hypothetical protein
MSAASDAPACPRSRPALNVRPPPPPRYAKSRSFSRFAAQGERGRLAQLEQNVPNINCYYTRTGPVLFFAVPPRKGKHWMFSSRLWAYAGVVGFCHDPAASSASAALSHVQL